jgi:hypothetical protein
MIAPDAISPLARYAALVAEVPVIRIADPDARALGLREGQVVQALVEAQGDARFFDFGGRRYEVPAAWQHMSPGDPRWFRVGRQGEAFVLRPIANPSAQALAESTTTASSTGAAPASGSGVVTTPPPVSQAAYGGPLSARFLELLARPSGFSALAQVLVPGRLESVLVAAGAPDLARALVSSRLRSDALSPEAIRRAVAHGGMWGESMLASGQQIAQLDLKVLLRQISRVLSAKSAAVGAEVDEAINDIERKQIESIQQSIDGKLVFSVMLPFGDAPPASLRFERHPRGDDRGDGGYSIDLHIAPPRVGDLWMKTTVVKTNVDVTVWARRKEIAQIVSAASRQLGDDLKEAGLALRAFNVLEGVRPELIGPVAEPLSTGLDLRA